MTDDFGEPVGYCLGFPDINVILKQINGKLFPFGRASLILGAEDLQGIR